MALSNYLLEQCLAAALGVLLFFFGVFPPLMAHASIAPGSNVIRVAYIGGLTGANSLAAQKSLRAMKLVVDSFNRTGGLLGKKVEVVAYDNKSSAANNITIFRELDKSHIVGISGIHASNDGIIIANLAEQRHLPVVVASATDPQITKGKKYVVRTCFTDDDQGTRLAKIAFHDMKAHRVVVIVDVADSFTVALSGVFQNRFKALGGKITDVYPIRTNDKNYDQLVSSLKAKERPDVILIATSALEAGYILAQLSSAGSSVPVLGCDGWQNTDLGHVLKSLAQTHINALFTAHWYREIPFAASHRYIKEYESTYTDTLSSYDADAVLTYDSSTMLLTAIRKAKSCDPDKIMAALRNTTIHGATGTIRIGPNNEAEKEVGILRIANGKLMPYRMSE